MADLETGPSTEGAKTGGVTGQLRLKERQGHMLFVSYSFAQKPMTYINSVGQKKTGPGSGAPAAVASTTRLQRPVMACARSFGLPRGEGSPIASGPTMSLKNNGSQQIKSLGTGVGTGQRLVGRKSSNNIIMRMGGIGSGSTGRSK